MTAPHPGDAAHRCPGCGGRNDPSASACEWCGRPFVVGHQRITAPWLAPATLALIAIVGLATIVVAVAGARVSANRSPEAPPPTIVPLGLAIPPPTAERDVALSEDGAALSTADEFVRVANTGGTGAFLRREPRPNAPGVIAHREGTVLRVSGPDAVVEGRVWRQLEDAQGNRGWTPREFLSASEAGF